jgi:hypothetical protein
MTDKHHRHLLKGGKVGHKGGSGRPPDWLKNTCKKFVKQKRLIAWLASVASGDFFHTRVWVDDSGVTHHEKEPAAVKDRIRAIELLLERGWGKPAQEVTGVDGGPIVYKIVDYKNA